MKRIKSNQTGTHGILQYFWRTSQSNGSDEHNEQARSPHTHSLTWPPVGAKSQEGIVRSAYCVVRGFLEGTRPVVRRVKSTFAVFRTVDKKFSTFAFRMNLQVICDWTRSKTSGRENARARCPGSLPEGAAGPWASPRPCGTLGQPPGASCTSIFESN